MSATWLVRSWAPVTDGDGGEKWEHVEETVSCEDIAAFVEAREAEHMRKVAVARMLHALGVTPSGKIPEFEAQAWWVFSELVGGVGGAYFDLYWRQGHDIYGRRQPPARVVEAISRLEEVPVPEVPMAKFIELSVQFAEDALSKYRSRREVTLKAKAKAAEAEAKERAEYERLKAKFGG
jgi:hypothetical protein